VRNRKAGLRHAGVGRFRIAPHARHPRTGARQCAFDTPSALLVNDATHDLARAAARVGIGERALLGLTKRYFIFSPKVLAIRTRFLRALLPMLLDAGVPDFAAVPAGYHDVSISFAMPTPYSD